MMSNFDGCDFQTVKKRTSDDIIAYFRRHAFIRCINRKYIVFISYSEPEIFDLATDNVRVVSISVKAKDAHSLRDATK